AARRSCQPPRLDDAALEDRDEPAPVLEDLDVVERIAVDDQDVRELAGLKRADLLVAAEDLGAGLRGAAERVGGGEADLLHEEGELLRVVAVGGPGEAVVAAHAERAAGVEDPARAVGAALEGFLVAVDDPLGHAEFLSSLDAGLFEV